MDTMPSEDTENQGEAELNRRCTAGKETLVAWVDPEVLGKDGAAVCSDTEPR